jgi:hypothetical protein
MGSGQKPLQQIISNIGQNFNTSANAMIHQPGITTAGLALGVPKGIVDVPAYLGGGVKEGWDYLRGNIKPHGENILDNYEKGWRDLAINVGSLGQNTDRDRLEKERAAGASLTMTSMASPGIPLPGIGKALKGGAAGIAGENLVKGITAASDYISPVAGKLASPILDPMLKSTGKLVNKLETATSSVLPGENKEFLKLMSNSKSTTNYIKSKDPHVLATLSDKYQLPLAKIDDLGEPLANKYRDYKGSIEDKKLDFNKSLEEYKSQKDLYKTKKTIINQELKTSDIPGELKSQVKKDLLATLKKPTAPIRPSTKLDSLDTFIDTEIADIKMSGESRHLLKEELKTNILYNQKYNDLTEATTLYNNLVNKAKSIKEAGKIISDTPEIAKYIDEFDNTSLVKASQRLRTNYDTIYSKSLLTGDDDLIKQAHNARLSNNESIIAQLEEINPELVKLYDQTATSSLVGEIGKYSNMFKAEPYIGDLVQVSESFPVVKLNNAEALGLNYNDALRAERSFGSWYEGNRKLVEDTIYSKYKNQLKALHEFDGLKFDNSSNLKKGISGGLKVLQDKFDEVGYSFQSGARERMIEGVLLPSAYGQVKAWGKLAEGTPAFNNAVMNRVTKFMQDTGMIPTHMKSVAELGPNKYKTLKHLDEATKEAINTLPIPEALKSNLKASALFMTTWVKGAAQAKLQNYNAILESLRDIGKSGKVTEYQRHRIITSLASIMTTSTIFGVRGMRVPFIAQEMFQDPTSSQTDQIPETVGSLLVNWFSDTLKFDNDLRYKLRDGAFKVATGRSSARTETIPFFGAGLGNEIATSMLYGKGSKIIDAAIESAKSGNPQLFMEKMASIITPNDIDMMVNQQVEGKSYDSKGEELNLPERGTIINQIGAISKNLPPEYEKKNDPKYTEIDTSIKKEFSRLSFKELTSPENIDKLVDKAMVAYPNDPTKVSELVLDTITSTVTPSKTKLYKTLGKDASELLDLPDETIKDIKTLQRLSEKQVIELCAESVIFEEESQTMMLLIKAGKFDVNNEDLMNKMTDKVDSIYNKVTKEIQ